MNWATSEMHGKKFVHDKNTLCRIDWIVYPARLLQIEPIKQGGKENLEWKQRVDWEAWKQEKQRQLRCELG